MRRANPNECSLHTRREGTTTTGANTNGSDSTVPANGSSCISDILGIQDWQKYPSLCLGEFSKQEFLKRACSTGNGLPYHVRHRAAVEVGGYANFVSELRRAREALPPEIEKRAENFDVDKLEWFTIFVSVRNWKLKASRKASTDVEVEADISRQPSDDEEKEFDDENDTPAKM